MVVDARSVLERDGREDRRHRPGEHRPAARAVRVFPGGAARLALDLAARERVAAVVRAHALVLAAVPVMMVVLAHVPAWKSEFRRFVLNSRVDLHAIDATHVRWRGDVGSSPLDGTRLNQRGHVIAEKVHPTHWLISA